MRSLVSAFLSVLICAALPIVNPLHAGDESRDPSGAAIVSAAASQQWQRVAQLRSAPDANRATSPDGMTALHWAVYWKHAATIKHLIEADFDVNATTHYEVTPLSIACVGGHGEAVNLLLNAGAEANHLRPGKETPLMTAARTGDADCVRYLIEAGAELDAREQRGQTALMWAAAEGNVEAVDLLLQAGADPAIQLRSGFTALLFAARQGKRAVVQRLLEAGVDVNLAMQPANRSGRNPRKGMSALLLAVESGHFQLAIDLVRAGADPNDQRSGFAPLHAVTWVRKTKRGDNVDGDPPPRGSGNLTSLAFVREIVGLGADLDLRLQRGSAGRAKLNPKGASPFLLAAHTADLPLMNLLEELGADLEATNSDGCTPLMAAAGVGVTAVGEYPGSVPEVIEAIQWLVDRGADVNAVDNNRETAMHGACYRTYPEVVDLLSKLGADPAVWDHQNRFGWTPLMIAQGKRPGSVKPSPETIAAVQRAKAKRPSR